MSHVLHKEQCPQCASKGQDSSKDNLAVYSDGHLFCFACGYYRPSPTSERIRQLSESSASSSILQLPSFMEERITPSSKQGPEEWTPYDSWPANVRAWLEGYGITKQEVMTNRIYYGHHDHRLYFPVNPSNDICRVVQSRYFGTDPNQPKYFTQGPKSRIYKLFTPTNPPPVVILVEDFISALKVGRHYLCIPLLGAHFNANLPISLLSKTTQMRVWLDFDKAKEAVKLASMSRQYIADCGTIITLKDPKAYTNKEIIEIVGSTLPSSDKGIPKS